MANSVVPQVPTGPAAVHGRVLVPAGAVRRPRATDRTPPPRPMLTSELAPPVPPGRTTRPGMLRLAAALVVAAAGATTVGLVAALADGAALRERLTATATTADPLAAAEAITEGVRVTTVLVLGAPAAAAALTLLWTALLLGRRAWARWALLATGLVALFLLDVGQSVVGGGTDVDRAALLTSAGLLLVALVLLFAPSTRGWLRDRR